MKRILMAMLALWLSPCLWAADLEIEVHSARNDKGTMNFYLYHEKDAASFLKDGFQGFACKVYSPIQGGKAVAKCPDLAPGVYALSLFHDENTNFNFDLNFVGLPKEGYGFSNNLKPLGAPKFAEAQFKIGAEPIKLTIKCLY